MDIVLEFLEFERQQTKTIRGDKVMYDVKGYYKYLDNGELFEYFMSTRGKTISKHK